MLIDVVGYTIGHTHDDRYYTEGESDTAVAAAVAPKANSADVYTKTEADAAIAESNEVAFASATPAEDLSPLVPETPVTLDITVPLDGVLIVNGNANIVAAAGIAIDCWINIDDPAKNSFHGVGHASNYIDEWADNLGFDVTAGDNTLYLGCQQLGGLDSDQAFRSGAQNDSGVLGQRALTTRALT